jgi:hypothetical protein
MAAFPLGVALAAIGMQSAGLFAGSEAREGAAPQAGQGGQENARDTPRPNAIVLRSFEHVWRED